MSQYTAEKSKSRFWAKVKKAGKSDCWEWLGARKPKGYGNVRINKKYTTAHRAAWEYTYGSIPNGMNILHSCDNPPCCNPSHLMLGTTVSNYVDMVRKGRQKAPAKRLGESNPLAKLTTEQVKQIRGMYIRGTTKQIDIANIFGVTQSAISAIILWKVRQHG